MSDNRIQDAREVAYRALCLAALLKRGELEIALQNMGDIFIPEDLQPQIIARYHDVNDQLHQWLVDERIEAHLSQTERMLLSRPLSTWTERMIVYVSWQVESLGVMLWALDIFDNMPEFDIQFEPVDVLFPLDVLTPTIDFMWRATLRPADALRRMRDKAELWHWRSRVIELSRLGVRPHNGHSFDTIVRDMARQGVEDGRLQHLIDDDFPAFNKAYADLTPEEYAIVSAITQRRVHALNWLCELSAVWESIEVGR